MSIEEFIHNLQQYNHPNVFNPWRDYDPECDIGPEAPQIRSRQLAEYLQPRLARARYLFVAEAAGYQGCRFTGIAITCERMLLGGHKQITGQMVLGYNGIRTSRPDCVYMTSRPQRDSGMNEPTDTYVWGAIADNGLDPNDVLLWNIFPFHPHKAAAPFTNRTPTDEELADGLTFTLQLLELCGHKVSLGAIGKKSGVTLHDAGLTPIIMRHPANGGAGQFRREFATWLDSIG
jgi:hypothetical protein